MPKHATLAQKPAKDRPSTEQLLEDRKKYMLSALLTYYSKPMQIVRGEGQFVFDEQGKRYLDGFAGIVTISIGHCHPHFVRKLQEQVSQLVHTTTLYLHPSLTEFATRLIAKAKSANPAMEACYFTSSGSEANEVAALLAKNATGSHEFLALRHAYHGRTLLTMGFTGQGTWRHSTPYYFGVSHVPSDYHYRRPEGVTPQQYSDWCVRELKETVRCATSGRIAACIAEPIQGNGGVVVPMPGYFPQVYDAVKKAGGLFICDEVQTGVGRTGRKFFGIEHWGVKPDIITMAKGLGNGFPIGAVLMTREVSEAMRGKLHINTFGGNPMAMAAGGAVLDVLEKEKLPDNAHEVGSYLKKRFEAMAEDSRWIGDVRGMGLMLGVELVKDKKTKEIAPQEAARLLDLAKDRGLLIGKGGLDGNILRIKPPLCFTKKDADFMADVIEDCLKQL